jgi:hypothetical protein
MSKWINKTTVQLAAGGTNNTGSSSTVNFAAAGAGNLLVAVASGSVTSTLPTGWTLGTSAVGSSGTYVWWKLAAANESSFSTTHNGSGYPNAYVVYEFPAGSSFVKGSGTAGLANGTANPTISALTGTNLLMASVSESYPYTTFNGTGITWPAGTTVDTDIHAAHISTDGYWLGIGFAEDSTATSYGPNPTITDPNGVVASERLTWAIHVNPTITKVASTTTQFNTTGTVNLTVPAGVTSNHLAVVMVADANAYSDTDTVTAPAGWTTQANKPAAANNSSVSIYTKLGGYSAGQSIPFTTNSGAIWAVYAVWYDTQGYDIGIVGTGGGRSGTSSAITTVPGITTTDANQDVIIVATERTLTTGTTVSASGFTPTVDLYTEDPNASANTATSGYFAHYTKTTAGATGNLTLTYAHASGNGFGMMFGIQTPKTAPVKIVGTPTTTDVPSTAATTTSVSVPTGARVGEILLATHLAGGAGGLMTPPSGWNTVKTYSDASKNSVQVAYRVVDGTEPTSYTWTHGSTTVRTFTLSRVSGTNTAAPVRTSASLDPATQGQTQTGPSLTGVQSTDQTFYFFTSGDANSATQASAPTISTSGWTTDFSRVNGQESAILAHANALGSVAAPTVSGSATTLIWASAGFALEPYGAAASTKTATFVDNFTTQSGTNWTGYGTGASVVSGQLQLTVATAYYGISTNSYYDLTNSSITAQLAGVPNVGNGTTETFLIYGPDNNNKVQWGWGNGVLDRTSHCQWGVHHGWQFIDL